ncbi:MAG: trypsin-like peptidase domain-containing protein [Clostridia bacterium]|nr:trypsin-like peptidase domain-containing protein [Clostridia bacterium]
MTDWNEDNNLNPEQPSGVPEENPQPEQPSGAPEEHPQPEQPSRGQAEEPDRGDAPVQQPSQPGNNDIWAYSWDGREQQKKSRKGSKVFFIIAAICLVLCVAICIPTVLYSFNASRRQPAGTESGQEQTSKPADQTSSDASVSRPADQTSSDAGETESSVEVHETIQKSDTVYREESELTKLWDLCSPSCATIYVETSGRYAAAYIGSGFVLTPDGYIATNQHLVEGGTKFTVTFYDGTKYEAKLIGEDEMRDLAVLKIDAQDLKVLEIGDSSALRSGQTVIAIGTPYDISLAGTMTCGIVSGVNREVAMTDDYGRAQKTMTLIQTDATINPGNSGGPLINLAGQVVGINFMKLQNEYEGLGFAIPINNAIQIFNQLIQYGKVVQDPSEDFVFARARIGVTVSNVDAGLESISVKPTANYPAEGAFVVSVEPASSVYAEGLRQYDIIVEFNGQKITGVSDLTEAVGSRKAGETVTMRFYSFNTRFTDGEYKTITFQLGKAN